MECPKCRLLNPPGALRCDCGWDFPSGTLKRSYLEVKVVPDSELATLRERLTAQLIDSIIVIGPAVVARFSFAISHDAGALIFAGAVLFAFFYLWFADGFSNGQSYGKRIIRIAVVDRSDGRPCTFTQSFVRNVLLSILGPVDWAFIFGSRRQRLGDKAANTVVVRASPIA